MVAFLRGIPVPSGDGKGKEPEEPSDGEDEVGVDWHGSRLDAEWLASGSGWRVGFKDCQEVAGTGGIRPKPLDF